MARSHGFALVALGAAFWGTDALFRRGLALELPASLVVFIEHAILVAITSPLALRALRRRPGLTTRDVAALILVGAGSSALATIMFTRAFTYGSPTTPLLLQKLQPLFAVSMAHIVLRERVRPRYAIFLSLGIGGAYLITFPDPSSISIDSVIAGVLAVGAAGLWAMGTVLGRYLSPVLSFAELTALRFAVGLPAAGLVAGIDGGLAATSDVGSSDVAALILLALIPGLLALLIYYRGLRETPASAATIAELAFPLSAIVVNRLVFDAALTTTQWLGIFLLWGTIMMMNHLVSRSSLRIGVAATNAVTRRARPRVAET